MAATSSYSPGTGHSFGLVIPLSLQKRCKSIECVLEEVKQKGSLIERVAELEKSVSKLCKSACKIPSRDSNVFADRPVLLSSTASSKAKNIPLDHVSSLDLPAVEEKHVEVLRGELEQFPIGMFGHVAEFELLIKEASQQIEGKRREGIEQNEEVINDPVHQFEKKVASQKHSKKKSMQLKEWFCAFPSH